MAAPNNYDLKYDSSATKDVPLDVLLSMGDGSEAAKYVNQCARDIYRRESEHDHQLLSLADRCRQRLYR